MNRSMLQTDLQRATSHPVLLQYPEHMVACFKGTQFRQGLDELLHDPPAPNAPVLYQYNGVVAFTPSSRDTLFLIEPHDPLELLGSPEAPESPCSTIYAIKSDPLGASSILHLRLQPEHAELPLAAVLIEYVANQAAKLDSTDLQALNSNFQAIRDAVSKHPEVQEDHLLALWVSRVSQFGYESEVGGGLCIAMQYFRCGQLPPQLQCAAAASTHLYTRRELEMGHLPINGVTPHTPAFVLVVGREGATGGKHPLPASMLVLLGKGLAVHVDVHEQPNLEAAREVVRIEALGMDAGCRVLPLGRDSVRLCTSMFASVKAAGVEEEGLDLAGIEAALDALSVDDCKEQLALMLCLLESMVTPKVRKRGAALFLLPPPEDWRFVLAALGEVAVVVEEERKDVDVVLEEKEHSKQQKRPSSPSSSTPSPSTPSKRQKRNCSNCGDDPWTQLTLQMLRDVDAQGGDFALSDLFEEYGRMKDASRVVGAALAAADPASTTTTLPSPLSSSSSSSSTSSPPASSEQDELLVYNLPRCRVSDFVRERFQACQYLCEAEDCDTYASVFGFGVDEHSGGELRILCLECTVASKTLAKAIYAGRNCKKRALSFLCAFGVEASGRCCVCDGRELHFFSDTWQLGHRVAHSKGERGLPQDLVPCFAECNQDQGVWELDEYRRRAGLGVFEERMTIAAAEVAFGVIKGGGRYI